MTYRVVQKDYKQLQQLAHKIRPLDNYEYTTQFYQVSIGSTVLGGCRATASRVEA